MHKFKTFDIIGPVMVGPSSSHTAGAARLAKMVRILHTGTIKKIDFKLFGSFAQTYKGHGTDRALLAGIMNIEPDDYRLRDSYKIAEETGLKYKFIPDFEGKKDHPNTIRFEINKGLSDSLAVEGCSIGGGNVVITEINGIETKFTGEKPILITKHKDAPGVISAITTLLYEKGVNIGNMKVDRFEESGDAAMYMELDKSPNIKDLKKDISNINGMKQAQMIDLEYMQA